MNTANMSYCRFENTARDLKDCVDHWTDQVPEEMDESERKARQRIIVMARDIVEQEGDC